MRNILSLSLSLILISIFTGCIKEEDDPSTYSSCKITNSTKPADLKQCWNASGNGYKEKSDAMLWCKEKATNYMTSTYGGMTHTISTEITSKSCE